MYDLKRRKCIEFIHCIYASCTVAFGKKVVARSFYQSVVSKNKLLVLLGPTFRILSCSADWVSTYSGAYTQDYLRLFESLHNIVFEIKSIGYIYAL